MCLGAEHYVFPFLGHLVTGANGGACKRRSARKAPSAPTPHRYTISAASTPYICQGSYRLRYIYLYLLFSSVGPCPDTYDTRTNCCSSFRTTQASTPHSTTMDSMRSLNTSLPSSTPRTQPPEQLLQQFKAAALSVTNLYKNAVCEQAQAKAAGYQEAVEDLLHFLDRENLGLGDGEGWKVRQWATERCDGTTSQTSDEEAEAEKRDRSATPTTTRKDSSPVDQARQHPTTTHTPAAKPETVTPPSQPHESPSLATPATFTFSAGPTYPEHDMDVQSDNSTANAQDGAPVSVSVMPRNARPHHRHNNLARSNQRPSPRESPASLGSKRKFTFPDFFDLSGLNNGRDMGGGGKRGRFT